MTELGKKDKKLVRQLIETGLLRELERGIKKVENVISDWQKDKSDPKATYHKLFKTLTDHDDGIARRYDGMTGSKYVRILIEQVMDEVITPEDLQILPQDLRERIVSVANDLKG